MQIARWGGTVTAILPNYLSLDIIVGEPKRLELQWSVLVLFCYEQCTVDSRVSHVSTYVTLKLLHGEMRCMFVASLKNSVKVIQFGAAARYMKSTNATEH